MLRRRYTARHVGRTRERLAEMLVDAFKAIGETIEADPSKLRPAQGRWRSDFRMDVMRWEGSCRWFLHGHWHTASLGCWSTMTDCVRFGIEVEHGDIFGMFEVSALDDIKSYRARQSREATP